MLFDKAPHVSMENISMECIPYPFVWTKNQKCNRNHYEYYMTVFEIGDKPFGKVTGRIVYDNTQNNEQALALFKKCFPAAGVIGVCVFIHDRPHEDDGRVEWIVDSAKEIPKFEGAMCLPNTLQVFGADAAFVDACL